MPWKFTVPKNFWENIENVKKYTNWLSAQLNIKTMSDWYNVTITDITLNGGKGIMKKFNSVKELLEIVYPNYKWDLYRFKSGVPKGYLQDLSKSPEDQIKFIEYLVEKLEIKKTVDWYLITSNQLQDIVSIGTMDTMIIVKKYYPDLDLDYFRHYKKNKK